MKIKVVKSLRDYNCYECGGDEAARGVTEWDDMSLEDYCKLRNAVSWANLNRNDQFHYAIIEQVEDTKSIFASAKEFFEYQEKQKTDRENEARKRKAERESKSKERKLKQLEKLKKELNQ
jgi:hypothetical protein